MSKVKEKEIFVERDTFTGKDGRDFYTYFIKGTVRGREVKAAVVPPDKGGYVVLDIVFGGSMSAKLILKPYSIKDEATGKVNSGHTYAVQSVDDDGTVYEAPIKPYRSSDKTIINMLLA